MLQDIVQASRENPGLPIVFGMNSNTSNTLPLIPSNLSSDAPAAFSAEITATIAAEDAPYISALKMSKPGIQVLTQ